MRILKDFNYQASLRLIMIINEMIMKDFNYQVSETQRDN